MPAKIRPTRLEVSDRFPMLGFSIRAEGPPLRAEVALGSEPGLFGAEGKARRTTANFYSTRGAAPLRIARGEAVFIVPPEVLARFVGNEKLYFGLATGDGEAGAMQVTVTPTEASPYVSLRGLTGRSMQRVRVLPSRQQRAAGYNNGGQSALEWAGDVATPGMEPARPSGNAAPSPLQNGAANGNRAMAAAPEHTPYDDGFGPMPSPAAPPAAPPAPQARPTAAPLTPGAAGASQPAPPAAQGLAIDVPDDRGIEGPVYGDDGTESAPAAQTLGAPAPEYEGASRFAPAPSFQRMTSPRAINRVVIHVTDGPSTRSAINTFTNPNARVSIHYLVGQDGEVIQLVAENDIAYHANGANGDSIGIEHVAIKRGGVTYNRPDGTPVHYDFLPLTDAQYCASAALTTYLCGKYGLAPDRSHIMGHAEADPRTGHSSCPLGAEWDWDHYIRLVAGRYCEPRSTPSVGQALATARSRPRPPLVVGPRPLVVGRSLAHVVLAYAPTNPDDAARAMADFARREAGWRAGVPDTGFFPHSAICHLELTDLSGKLFYGTGFYVANDLILSVAHNFAGMASARILAGRNGSGSFLTDFTVGPDDWSIHPAYVPDNTDHDLAVVRVPTPPPTGAAFGLLEALSVCRDSRIIVCGYGAETVDPFVQHLDGDAVRELSANSEVMRYNLQTEKGNSGSPVFQVWGYEDEARQMSAQEIRLVGVHSAGHDAALNQACCLTENKIAWIRGRGLVSVAQALVYAPRAAALSRGLSAGSFTLNWDEVESVAQPTGLSCWATAAAMLIGWRDRVSLTPEHIAEICNRPIDLALQGVDFQAFANEMGLTFEYPVCYTVDGFRALLENKGPLWVFALVPSGHAIVVTGLYSDGANTFVRITDPWDRTVGAPGTPGSYLPTHATGSRYIMAWDDFMAEYEAGSAASLQVLHAGGAAGRTLNTGPTIPVGYAMSGRTGRALDADQPRTIGSGGGVDWDLMQYPGMKNAASMVAAANAINAAPITLADWPYLEEADGSRTQAALTIDWKYDASGSVGAVRIVPGQGTVASGRTLKVTATVEDVGSTPSLASLQITIRYAFGRASESEHLAVTTINIYGDGKHTRRGEWLPSAQMAA